MIIRKNETGNWKKEPYAECDIYSGIMTIYEKTLFKQDISKAKKFLIEAPDNDDRFSISIFLCLLHEICSHLKLAITNKIIKSPNVINDPHNNYNELKLENGESGRTMEYYISEDINKIKFLKFSFSPKKVLYNPKLWTEENFENLNKIIENLMEKQSKDYLENILGSFPSPKNVMNEEKIKSEENQNEGDWELSSPAITEEDEDPEDNKLDSTKEYKIENESISQKIKKIKPIIKY